MGKSEGKIEDYLISLAKQADYMIFKFLPLSINGVPDRILIGNGYTIFIEIKAPGEKPRKLQTYIHNQMQKRGAIVKVIDTKIECDNLILQMKNKIVRK